MTSRAPVPFHYRTGYLMSSEVSPRRKTYTAHSREKDVTLGQDQSFSSAVLYLHNYKLMLISVGDPGVTRNRQTWSSIMYTFKHFENQYNLLVFQSLTCMILTCRHSWPLLIKQLLWHDNPKGIIVASIS